MGKDLFIFKSVNLLPFVITTWLNLDTVETHLTTTSLKRPPLLKTTFGAERNISLYFMFDLASIIRPVS